MSPPRISVLCNAIALRLKHGDAEDAVLERRKYNIRCPFQFEVDENGTVTGMILRSFFGYGSCQ